MTDSSGYRAVQVLTDENSEYSGKKSFLIIMLVGPLLNIWIWLKIVSFFKEAIFEIEKLYENNPTKTLSLIFTSLVSSLFGCIAVPFVLWIYTSTSMT